MEIDFEKLANCLAPYGLPQYWVHVSGREMPLQLRSGLNQVDPQRIFPIRTENAKLFARFMMDLPSKILAPEKQKEYHL